MSPLLTRTLVGATALAAAGVASADLTVESSLPCGYNTLYDVEATDQNCGGGLPCYHPARTIDFPIDAHFAGNSAKVILIGGDGGDVDIDCIGVFKFKGGQGAIARFYVHFGYGPGELLPGGTLRAIVGKSGKNEFNPDPAQAFFTTSGGGGGGTALLYLPPNQNWENGIILGVAGGGGGATITDFNNLCGSGQHGRDASLDANGTDGRGPNNGGDGGTDGGDGTVGTRENGGWAGYGGVGIGGFPISGLYSVSGAGGGGVGFGAGGLALQWGLGDGDDLGSGGGGGGGYSGGGGGSHKHGGGGGGTWINPAYTSNVAKLVDDDSYSEGHFKFVMLPSDNASAPKPFVPGATLIGTTCANPILFWTPCGSSVPWPDAYFQTTNIETCPIDLSFDWNPADETEITFHDPGELGTPIGCGSGGHASIELLPGQSIVVRVASNEASYDIATSYPVADADGDGVCNALDVCPTGDDTTDCNQNDIPDCAEDLAFETIVRQDFDDAGGHPFHVTGSAYVTSLGIGRLTDAPGQIGTFLVQAPQLYEKQRNWEASFDFRVGDEIPGGEGVALALYTLFDAPTPDFRVDSQGYSPDVNATPLAQVSFDTNMGPGDPSANFLRFYGPSGQGGEMPVSYDMDDGQWYRATVRFESAADFLQPCYLTVRITPVSGGATETILNHVNVGTGALTPAWFAFGASTTTTGRNTRIDNVVITDFVHGDDCDGDGIPNECDTAGCETPLNDDCGFPTEVGLGTIGFDTTNATLGSPADIVGASDLRDVWFRYVPTCDVRLHASMSAAPGSCPQPSIWTTCGGTLLSANFCADAVADLSAGMDVLIRVAYSNGVGAPGTLTLWLDEPDSDGDLIPDFCDNCPYIPNFDQTDEDGNGVGDVCEVTNDDCETAKEVLFGGGNGSTAVVNFDCRIATDADPFGSCYEVSGNHDLWYLVTATCNGPVTISDLTLATGISGLLTVYDECQGNELGCTVVSGPPIEIQATPGQTLLVRVASNHNFMPPNVDLISGTFTVSLNDADEDGVTDAEDECPGFDDHEDVNENGIPDGCEVPCAADLDLNNAVDFNDLLQLLAAWGAGVSGPEDLDGNFEVNFNDLLILLAAWGPCP